MASNSCFDDVAVKQLIEVSSKLDKCFNGEDTNCSTFQNQKPLNEQKVRNSKRLIPFDRTQGDRFMDKATGLVSVTFGEYGGPEAGSKFNGSGQKISSCHIITSAHLLYSDGMFPVDSEDMKVSFKSGQTCDSSKPFAKTAPASVFFKMTQNTDYVCDSSYNNGSCAHRQFNGYNDLVILKLKKGTYDKNDSNYFKLNTTAPNSEHSQVYKIGQRVNCWGFPGHNENIKLPRSQSNMLLWAQKDAQIFGDDNGKSVSGLITNAISYKGMSGGGCVIENNPRELIGIFANDNRVDGQSAFEVAPEKQYTESANYLSTFHKLAQRYEAETGKKLSNLNDECE